MIKDTDVINIVKGNRPLIISSFKVDGEVEEYATSLVKLLTTPFITLGFKIKFINTVDIKNPTEIVRVLDHLLMKKGDGLKIDMTATTRKRTLLVCCIESCNTSLFNYMLIIIIYIVEDVINVFLY